MSGMRVTLLPQLVFEDFAARSFHISGMRVTRLPQLAWGDFCSVVRTAPARGGRAAMRAGLLAKLEALELQEAEYVRWLFARPQGRPSRCLCRLRVERSSALAVAQE